MRPFPLDVASRLRAVDPKGAAALGIRLEERPDGSMVVVDGLRVGILRVYPQRAKNPFWTREISFFRAVEVTTRYLRLLGETRCGACGHLLGHHSTAEIQQGFVLRVCPVGTGNARPSPVERAMTIWRHERGLSQAVARGVVREAVIRRYKEREQR